MTQTKWIDVNGQLYEGTIETVQNCNGIENDELGIATVVINGIKIRKIVLLFQYYDSPEAYYECMLDRATVHLRNAKDDMQSDIEYHTNKVNKYDAEVKMWQSKLDLLKHD